VQTILQDAFKPKEEGGDEGFLQKKLM